MDYIITSESDQLLGSTNSTLTVQSIGLGDEGVYRCVASNLYGSDNKQAGDLTVQGITISTFN